MTSYHLLVSPLPTNLQNTIKVHTGENNIECGASIHAIFQLTVRRIKMFFSLKPFNPKWNHPSKFQLTGVRRFGGVREQTNTQTDSLTHSLTEWCFDREIINHILHILFEWIM